MILSRVSRLGVMARWLPTLGRLAWRLFRDDRVPLKHRAILAASAGYVAMPIDISPDFLPIIGKIDDLLVIAAGLGWIFRFAPDDVVDEHLAEMGLERRDVEDALANIVGSFIR
jgi:uncharacterized membrane protein YkvA (DUF1232 family)